MRYTEYHDGVAVIRDKNLLKEAMEKLAKYEDVENAKDIEIKNLIQGEHFGFKGFDWIVLDNNVDGGVLAIMASAWNNEEYSFDDDGCNNYTKSSLRRKLLNELLPVLGEDNLIPHEVDMVADNGNDRYGTVADRVFIMSCDECRKYRKHVPLLPEWMWTCTPWYITDIGYGNYVRYVGTDGFLYSNVAGGSGGVAPACVFKKDAVVEAEISHRISHRKVDKDGRKES